MGKIFNAIDRQIIRPRVVNSESLGFQMAQEDIKSFYSQGSPKRYERTGSYGESIRRSGVTGGNGNYDYEIYMEAPAYKTGTPGFPVLQEAQYNGSGILGKSNTWEDAKRSIENALKMYFS